MSARAQRTEVTNPSGETGNPTSENNEHEQPSHSPNSPTLSYNGALPPITSVQDVTAMEALVPEFTNEIASRIIKSIDQRLDDEREKAKSEIQRAERAQIGGAIVAVLGLLISGAVGVWGDWVASTAIILASIGGPVAVASFAVTLAKEASKRLDDLN